MKKLLHYSDCFMLLAGIIGCALRFWFGNTGLDGQGLYRASHPAWILLCLLSVGVVVFNWFLSREAGDNQNHSDNFPKSIVGGVSYLLLAAAMAYVGIMDLLSAEDFLSGIVAFTSMLAAICLAVAGVERFSGNKPVFFAHLVPCVHFALRLFLLGKSLGTEPEICGFLFQFFASLTLIPAFYWLWAFDVNMGNRKRSLFFSLCAIFFCLVATFEAGAGWAMYLVYAAMLLGNLCQQCYLPAREETEAAAEEIAEETEAILEETVEEVAEEIPEGSDEEVTEESPEEPAEETVKQPWGVPAETVEPVVVSAETAEPVAVPVEAPAPVPEAEKKATTQKAEPEDDFDDFLTDLKRYLDSQGY